MVNTNKYLKRHQCQYKQGKCCALCGELKDQNKMTVDHIIPRYLYGKPNDERNWQVLCQECHYLKSQMEMKILTDGEVPPEYLEKIKGLAILQRKANLARQTLHLRNTRLHRNWFNKAHVYFNHKDLEEL